jgi:anti-anti-sigma factor
LSNRDLPVATTGPAGASLTVRNGAAGVASADEEGEMEIDVARPGRTVILRGRLDVTTVADVRLALHAAVDSGTGDLLVDLGEVDVVDASGLGVLVGAHRRAGRAGRRLVLRNVPDRILRLLALTRLNRVLHVEVVVPAPLAATG